jgi:hypothetical protein
MPTATFRIALRAPTLVVALSLAGCFTSSTHQEGAGAAKKSPDAKHDLSALQGRWEQLPEEPGGTGTPRQRVVKEVGGNSETVTTYGPGGEVLHAQAAQFRLSRSGPVHVYTVQNPRVTGGSERGSTKASPGKLTYIYRVHGNEFDEVWGLVPGQEEREVVVKRWKREAPAGH